MTELEIKTLLRQRGASMSDVARAAGVTPQSVGRVIAGKDKSRGIAQLIANFLGKPVDTLWPGKYPVTYSRKSSEQVLMELRAAASHLQNHAKAA